MDGSEFRQRRERLLLTQADIAARLNVSEATVRNWESEATNVPTAVEMLWGVWEHRFEQETPSLGPVTLIYTDGPMFIDPQGPRRPLAMMQQEAFLTNAGALARVCAMWNRPGFNSPLIMKASGEVLWNAVQLADVFNGTDKGAPTVANMVRSIAHHARTYSTRYVRSGPNLPTQAEVSVRQRKIEDEADKLDALAASDDPTSADSEAVATACSWLRAYGLTPPAHLISGLAQAYHARELP
jgi:hypothetical protein